MRTKFMFLATLIGFSCLVSCTKDKSSAPPSDVSVINIPTRTAESILVFSSWEAYEATLEELTFLVDSLDDEFIALYDTLSEDSINYMEEFIGWNDMQPLDDFETTHDFVSMRRDFLLDEEEWLDNDELDMENTPEEKYFYLTLVELTLLNAHGAMVVGEDIIIFTNEGLHIIPELDWEEYEEYFDTQTPTGINVNKIQSDCVSYGGTPPNEDTYATNKKVTFSLAFHSFPIWASSIAKISSYKFSNNKWKKWRTEMAVSSYNSFYTSGCDFVAESGYASTKQKYTKNLVLRWTRWEWAYPFRVNEEQPLVATFVYGNTGDYLVYP